MEGKIVASSGGIYTVISGDVYYKLQPRGIFRYKKEHLFVGDDVVFDENECTITSIKERKNSLIRPRSSNIDQLFIVMSVVEPELSEELLYKFLTYANMNNIEAKVLFTKVDLLKNKDKLNSIINDLSKLNIKCFTLSPNNDEELEFLKKELANKLTIVMGQTGVGKSSALNAINPSFERLVGEYSQILGRGKHQTKEVILLPYEGGYLGDTPGFSSLELNLYKEDLAKFFPGYYDLYTHCFFTDCLHQNEKECEVKKEIENGKLSKDAYQIYLKLLEAASSVTKRYK